MDEFEMKTKKKKKNSINVRGLTFFFFEGRVRGGSLKIGEMEKEVRKTFFEAFLNIY